MDVITKRKRDLTVKSLDTNTIDPEYSSGVWDSEIKAFLDARTLKSLFFGEDWVFVLCDTVAAAVSSVPLIVYKKEVKENGAVTLEKDTEHPLSKLINQPNEYQDGSAFMYNLAVEDTLMGNAITWHAPASGQLFILPADTVEMKFESNKLSRYVSHGSSMTDKKEQVASFDPFDVMHIRRPNPSSLLWGLSPFVPGRKSVLFNRYSTDYLNAFYQKGAQPGLALKLDSAASEQSAMRLLKSFEMNYTGRRNQRRTLVLPKGVDIEQIHTSIADQNLVDLIKMNRENIMNILRVPKHALGLAESGSLGSEEAKQAIQFMWNNTITPMLKRIQGAFNKFFSKELGETHVIEFDTSNVAALKDDEIKKADLATKMLSVLTINEVREKVYQAEPTAGGDVVLSLKPPAPMFPTAPAVQPTPDTAPAVTNLVPNMTVEPVASVLPQKARDKFKARYGEWFTKADASAESTVKKDGAQIRKLSIDITSQQYADAIKAVAYELKMAQALTTKAKKDDIRKAVDKAVNKISYKRNWLKTYDDVLKSSVDVGASIQLGAVFNADARAAIEAYSAKDPDGRYASLNKRGIDTFANINKTTTDRIMTVVEEGLKDKKTIAEIARDIRNDFVEITPSRSDMIARTETLTAYSLGQWETTQAAKEVIPGMAKVWITSNDDRVRDSHDELDGAVVGVDEEFKNGLMFPRDPNGEPSETIQCRCSYLMVPPEDLADLKI